MAIEVPIHSAGIVGKPGQRAGNVDYESWATVLNINTMGPLRVTETFIDHLARGERKLAVTITSGMGSVTDNIRRLDCLSQFQGQSEGPRLTMASNLTLRVGREQALFRKRLQKGLDFYLQQTVTAPAPRRAPKALSGSAPSAVLPVRRFER